MTQRSPFSASNLARRIACPGSLAMEAGLPEVRTEESDEGTMLHALAADPAASRAGLTDEQLSVLELAARMETELIQFVESKPTHRLG